MDAAQVVHVGNPIKQNHQFAQSCLANSLAKRTGVGTSIEILVKWSQSHRCVRNGAATWVLRNGGAATLQLDALSIAA